MDGATQAAHLKSIWKNTDYLRRNHCKIVEAANR